MRRTLGARFFGMILSVLLLTLPLLGGQVRDLPDLAPVDRVGQSALYQSGPVRVLLLQGTPYQVGYAHGKLLAKDVARVFDRVLLICRASDGARSGNFFADNIENVHRRTLPYVPARYREELRGLADGAGLDFHRVELANLFPEMFHCSGFAFMGNATGDGKLIHGRVLDYMTEVGFQDHAVVIVTRTPGNRTVMLAGYAGFIGCVTGLNDRHLSIGEMGMGGEGNWDGTPMTYLLRQILEEYDNLPDVRDYFLRARKTCEYAYVVADGKVPDAIGVHARYDLVEFLKPGQSHPLLATPLPECILISAGDRYRHLVEKTRKAYGKLDVNSTIELIKRPVAMSGNLHNAVMLPIDNVMYLSDAAPPDQHDYQACYQPYYKHDLNRYLRMLDDLARDHRPTQPATVTLSATTRPASRPARGAVIEGTIPARLHRPIKPAADPALADRLKRFAVPAADVPYRMTRQNHLDQYDLWQVTFPSPVQSCDVENNTVWCEYFKSQSRGPRPAVIVLHILQNDFTLPRIVCHLLASAGIDALMVKMAYYGPRRPQDPARQKALMENLDTLVNGITQSVMDIRRAAEFLAAQPDVDRRRIGICGISLGALVGSLAIGVDGHFPQAALVLGGGNLVKMIQAHSREVKGLNDYLAKNRITADELAKRLDPIEPLRYIDRAADGKILLINARGDDVIPPDCTAELAARLPDARIVWYDADHRTMIWHLVDAVTRIQTFFKE